jgi:cyclase
VAGGRVVKGVRFRGLRDVGDPVELGALYSDEGADELVFLDVTATLEGRQTLVDLVERISERLSIPFTVGGGVRSVDDARELLEAGADKVASIPRRSSGAADLELPSSLARKRLSSRSTRRAVVRRARAPRMRVGRRSPGRARPSVRRGRDPAPSIDADGTRNGYDLELTADVAAAVEVPVIASGGAGEASHIAEALEVAQAALLASILHENPARLRTLRIELCERGVELR